MRILVMLNSNAFIVANSSRDVFNYVIGLVDTLRNRKITLNYKLLNELDLSRSYKQIYITIIKYVADDNKVLLAKLMRDISSYLILSVEKVVVTRFDILAILAFLEFIYSMKIAVFTPD